MSYLDMMLEGKPERYKQMVRARLVRGQTYCAKAKGNIVSRQVIATIMIMVDDIYVENKGDNNE